MARTLVIVVDLDKVDAAEIDRATFMRSLSGTVDLTRDSGPIGWYGQTMGMYEVRDVVESNAAAALCDCGHPFDRHIRYGCLVPQPDDDGLYCDCTTPRP